MDRLFWWSGGACLALWLSSIAIFLGTAFGLSRFRPQIEQTGCYLRDALLIFVECSPGLPAGSAIATVANAAWWLVLYSWWFAAPLLASDYAARMSLRTVLFTGGVAGFAALTFAGAVAFLVAYGIRPRRAREGTAKA
jgi:hypothetical protein